MSWQKTFYSKNCVSRHERLDKPRKYDIMIIKQEAKSMDMKEFRAHGVGVSSHSNGLPDFGAVKKKAAFTLAEVLITLGIIGIVAALTMPMLMNDVRNKELEANFKKKSAEVQNALQMVQHTEGMTIYGNITNNLAYNANGYNVTIKDVLLKQFKEPAKLEDRHEILSNRVNGVPHSYKDYSGTAAFPHRELDDGTIIVNKEFFIFINNNNHLLTNQRLWVDVNGFRGPNRHGYDLFQFCLGPGDKLDFECDSYTQKALIQKDYFTKLPK